MKIIAELVSGFQRGGWISRWDGQRFTKVVSASECTYHGDTDDSQYVILPEGFRGAVGEFHGVSNLSYQSSVVLVGFTDSELGAPTPMQGWNSIGHGFRAEACERINSFGEYLEALANNSFISVTEGGQVHPVSGNRLVELPYEWGDQSANHYVIISPKGEILYEVSGCGDRAPYPLNVDGTKDWKFSSSFEDRAKEQHEYEQAFWAAADQLGLTDEYRVLCRADYSEANDEKIANLARKIKKTMIHTGADARAEADNTGILRRLLKHYRNRQNPLRSLRKEKGGIWTFHRLDPDMSELPNGAVVYHGDGWWVTWIK